MKQFLPVILIFILFQLKADASHIMGGEVSYRHLGGLKYEVKCKLYRDCRGVPLNSPVCNMIGNNDTTKKKSLSLTLVSITDITNYCKRTSNPCYPTNQTISSSSPAIEAHVYLDTVDFNKADSSFKKYCSIKFGVGQCCGYVADFWAFAELNLCIAAANSSPFLSVYPNNILCCNQPYYNNNGALDTIDRDSLSYSFADPMTAWKYVVYWSGGKSSSSPFFDYWPSGYNKAKGPNPGTNPPIGTYLDPESGDLIFTPTDCSDITRAAIRVSEWRKDTTGKYVKIGEVRRDMEFVTVTCPNNNIPNLNGPYKYEVCAKQKICFNVSSSDQNWVPPPPGKASPPDTLSLWWNGGITNRGATFKIIDTTALQKKGQFCWTPKESDVSDLPYYFTATVNDNHCTKTGITTKSYSIKVKAIAKAKITKKLIKNGMYQLNAEITGGFKGTPQYRWEILDSTQKPLSNTDYYFLQTGKTLSQKKTDTVQFYRAGRYILHLYINNPPLNCPTDYFDSFMVAKVSPILQISPTSLQETWTCKSTLDTLRPILKNERKPVKYKWSSSSSDTLPFLIIQNKRDSIYRVDVYDSAGFHRYAEWKINLYEVPELNKLMKVSFCKGDTVTINGNTKSYADTIIWLWWLDGKKISTQKNIKVYKTGMYILQISDSTNCLSEPDSIKVDYVTIKNVRGKDIISCVGDTALLLDTSFDIGKKTYKNWFINSKLIGSGSKIKVAKTGEYILEIADSNQCLYVRDSISYGYMKLKADAGPDLMVCQNDSINFKAFGLDTSNGKSGGYLWYLQDFSSPSISAKNSFSTTFKNDGRLLLQLTQMDGNLVCSDLDTVYYSFRKLPEIIFDRGMVCQNEIEFDIHSIILKPTKSVLGKYDWKLLKTLKKPNGSDLIITDILYDKDTSFKNHYYLKVDKLNIDLKAKFMDSLILGLTYTDEFGCTNNSKNDANISIRSNVEVTFINNELKRCHGDSLIYLSNDFGVNYYGGKWFTVNDSAANSLWPQGQNIQLSEKTGTKLFNPKGGSFLLKYVLENNNCFSSKNAGLIIVPYPKIKWSQTDFGDSILLTNFTNPSERQEWYIQFKKMSESNQLKVSKYDAKQKVIILKSINYKCETDSVIVPQIIGKTNHYSTPQFTISPNPVKHELLIKTYQNKYYSLEIFNHLGQSVFQKSDLGSIEKLNIFNLANGLYSIVFQTGNDILMQKFIKISE